MKNSPLFVLIFFLISAFPLCAQEEEWKTKMSRDGLVSVKYRVYNQMDEEGEKSQIIEFKAITTSKASLEECVRTMCTDENHAVIMEGTEEARRIKDLPGGEWLTYYYYKPPWPMPASDVITRYKLEEYPSQRKAILSGTPAPDMYPKGDVPRMENNHTKYTFIDLGEEVEIVMYSWSIPLISAPNWLAKTWFPNGPANMVRGIASFAEEKEK